MADWTMVAGDTSPAIPFALCDVNGDAVDVSGAQEVRFIMAAGENAAATVDADVTLTEPANGKGYYAWQDGETDNAGSYLAHVRVTFGNGAVAHYPGDRYWEVRLLPKLGA